MHCKETGRIWRDDEHRRLGHARLALYNFSGTLAGSSPPPAYNRRASRPYYSYGAGGLSPGDAQHAVSSLDLSSAGTGGVSGAVRVGTLREHGDHGLGTFENIDGEMVVVDGHFFQVRSDGCVHEVADDVLSPFAVVTRFTPHDTVQMQQCPDLHCLAEAFDRLRHSDNFFFAIRVDGHFDYVKTRAMCKTAEGVPLAVAAAQQPEFECAQIAGTLVGFWTPEYAKTLNIPGYHWHFLSHDHRHGGHLLQCRGQQLRLQIQREGVLSIALPETEDFFKADLHQDPTADLEEAETDHRKP
jgi:acetolactate decarboxylase